jgi:hypothetical protein
VHGLPLPQKLWREEDVVVAALLPHPLGKADRNGGLDHDRGSRVVHTGLVNHLLHGFGVKVVPVRIIVGGRGDHDKRSALVSLGRVRGGHQRESVSRHHLFHIRIDHRRAARVYCRNPRLIDVEGNNVLPAPSKHG